MTSDGLIVRPGDTLILAFNGAITAADIDRLDAVLRPAVPESVKVVALGNVDQLAVYRPDPEPAHPLLGVRYTPPGGEPLLLAPADVELIYEAPA